eukprot:SM000172S03079  [mRNA]  locus=s172:185472:185938:+ [translate_table: standard]
MEAPGDGVAGELEPEAATRKKSSPIEERGWQKPAKKEWTKSKELQENHSVTSAKQPQVGEARLVEVGPLARARGSSEGSAGTKVQRPGHRPLQRDGQAHPVHLRYDPAAGKSTGSPCIE